MEQSANQNSQNKHRWTIFVRFDKDPNQTEIAKYIESVTFKLHPTFHPPQVTITKPPFQLSRLGWGTFSIDIKIKWKKDLKKSDTGLDHYLSFTGDGEQNHQMIRFEEVEQKVE